jgi:hypothetical protein
MGLGCSMNGEMEWENCSVEGCLVTVKSHTEGVIIHS